MKGVIAEEDWDGMKNDIVVDFVKDNHFTELRDMEILRERIQTMDLMQNYVGEYYSKEWAMKNVLMLSDEDITDMKQQIDTEVPNEPDQMNNGDNNE